ncbi:MAG: hypothetical protein QGH74_06615 [Candidatus Brocadiia bacterium]|jgi:hypothetical protein|nr:hypothetical protein [Candidatus Brocadiia bacterium]
MFRLTFSRLSLIAAFALLFWAACTTLKTNNPTPTNAIRAVVNQNFSRNMLSILALSHLLRH